MKPFAILALLASVVSAGDIEIKTKTAIAIAKAKLSISKPSTPVFDPFKIEQAKKIIYKTKVKRIEKPSGFQWVYVTSDQDSRETVLAHLKTDHSPGLQEVLKLVSIDDFSRYDLLAIHSLIHSAEWGWMAPRPLGRWETVCPTDGSPCVQTFIWELP